jgi:hypothetical protein
VKRIWIFFSVLTLLLVSPKASSAASIGDAALTISMATVSGAILGVSTLPFYEESGKHTKNIFYGAAIGAVAGVMISALAGVQQGTNGDDEEAALSRRHETLSWHRKVAPEKSTALADLSAKARDSVLVWSPVASVNF